MWCVHASSCSFDGQLAEQGQVRRLQVAALLRHLLDGDPAVAEDPRSPSMKVMELLHAAVFLKAGS
jgi:hypothetical protein